MKFSEFLNFPTSSVRLRKFQYDINWAIQGISIRPSVTGHRQTTPEWGAGFRYGLIPPLVMI